MAVMHGCEGCRASRMTVRGSGSWHQTRERGREIPADDRSAGQTVDSQTVSAGGDLQSGDHRLQFDRHFFHRAAGHRAIRRDRHRVLHHDRDAGARLLLRQRRGQLDEPRTRQTEQRAGIPAAGRRLRGRGDLRSDDRRDRAADVAAAGRHAGFDSHDCAVRGAIPDTIAGRRALRMRVVRAQRAAALPRPVGVRHDRLGFGRAAELLARAAAHLRGGPRDIRRRASPPPSARR